MTSIAGVLTLGKQWRAREISKTWCPGPNKHHFPTCFFSCILKLTKGQTWRVGGPVLARRPPFENPCSMECPNALHLATLTCLTAWNTRSSCESISVKVLICARLTFSLYPKATISSKAKISSNEWSNISCSSIALQYSGIWNEGMATTLETN